MKTNDMARLREGLVEILGEEAIESSGSTLLAYSSDMTENEPHPPEMVIFPDNTEQVARCLALADGLAVPVVPRVYNSNLGGLAIPERGGILMDLTRMNRILEVNPRDLYMVIEPGVTQADVHRLLAKEHPGLRFGYSLAPPDVSVLANCIMDGLVNLSYRFGAMSQWLNGLEVVLPNGEVVRTGSAAVVNSWHGEAPLPHLNSLFINAFGTTGVVTKAAVQLWPGRQFEKRYFVLSHDYESTYHLFTRLIDTEIPDDIGILSWPLGKLLFGNKKPLYRDPAEPLFFVYVSASSDRDVIMRDKVDHLREIVSQLRQEGRTIDPPLDVNDIIAVEASFSRFTEFPTSLDFLLDHGGGGLTWLGTYGPVSKWIDGVRAGMEFMQRNGMPPVVVSRLMWGGHFMVLRFIMMFDKSNREEVGRIRRLSMGLFEKVIDLGYIPYKTPSWAYSLLAERMDPTFRKLMRSISISIDPNRIMNPGKWPI